MTGMDATFDLTALPDETLCLIFGFLEPSDLDNAQKCCRRLDGIVQDTYRQLYRSACQMSFGIVQDTYPRKYQNLPRILNSPLQLSKTGYVIPHRKLASPWTWQTLFREKIKITTDLMYKDGHVLQYSFSHHGQSLSTGPHPKFHGLSGLRGSQAWYLRTDESLLVDSRILIALLAGCSLQNPQVRQDLAKALMVQKRFDEAEPHYQILLSKHTVELNEHLATASRLSWPFSLTIEGPGESWTDEMIMLAAITAGDVPLVKAYQARGVPVEYEGHHGSAIAAVTSNSQPMVEYLAVQGVDFLRRINGFSITLWVAIEHAHLGIIRFLVRLGAPWYPGTARFAILSGRVELLREFAYLSDVEAALPTDRCFFEHLPNLTLSERHTFLQYLVEVGYLDAQELDRRISLHQRAKCRKCPVTDLQRFSYQ